MLNISGVSQSLGGWFLSDSSSDYRKFKIPAGTSLAPDAFLVFNESHFNNPGNPASLVPFSLNSSGDDVFLVQADSAGNLLKFVDRVEFSSTPGDMTYGRAPDGTGAFALLRSNSPGAANAAAIPEYAAWVASKFPANAPGTTTALTADPDFDGLNNLLEFAFKLDPLIPNGSPVSVAASTGGSPLEITYKLRHDVPGLTARVDVSDDLETWDITESRIELLNQPPQPDGTTTHTARLNPLPASVRTFLRITIGL